MLPVRLLLVTLLVWTAASLQPEAAASVTALAASSDTNTAKASVSGSTRSSRAVTPDDVCTALVPPPLKGITIVVTPKLGVTSLAPVTFTLDDTTTSKFVQIFEPSGSLYTCSLELGIDGKIGLVEVVFAAGPTPGCSFLISSDALKDSLETCCRFDLQGEIDLNNEQPADGQISIEAKSRPNPPRSAGNTVLQLQKRVVDTSENCCDGLGTLKTDVCRPAAGECDLEEKCDGKSPECPTTDRLKPATTVCRRSQSPCRMDAACTGEGPNCPANLPRPNGTKCPWYPATPHSSDYYNTESSTLQRYQPTPEEATALAASSPAHKHHHWAPCIGKCYDGVCALRTDHPTCCVARTAEYAAAAAAVAAAAPNITVSTTSTTRKGQWYWRDLYCWK